MSSIMMSKELWQKIISGDKESYRTFYITYYKRLYNYGRKFTMDTVLIEDCIQDIFMDFWNKKADLSGLQSPLSYFFSAFRYRLLKGLRQASRQIETEEAEIEFYAEQQIIMRESDSEARSRLKAGLDALTPRQREAVYLKFYEGFSYEEMADAMNISVKGTYKIIARSLQSLKDLLKTNTIVS